MKWHQRTPYSIASGIYTVSKCDVMGEKVYSAWYGDKLLQTRLKDAESAKQICEEHQQRRAA